MPAMMLTKTEGGPKMHPLFLGQASVVFEDPGALQKSFGTSPEGLPVIAIGPKGGKIVAYKGGKPVYAGSAGAKKYAVEQKAAAKAGVKVKPPKLTSAQIAAQVAPDPFPKDLSKLVKLPAGKFAGSHGNLLFQDPATKKKFIFKHDKLVIALAEEACSRIGALVLPGAVQSAKMVKLHGEVGALVAVADGYEPIGKESESMAVSPGLLQNFQKHFDGIVQQHVFDWMMSQHDTHGDNLGVVNGKVYGIDKGQAWRFLGKDALPKKGSEDSKSANPNPSKQVYSQFWKAYHDGKLTGDPVKAASEVFSRLAALSDVQVQAILMPYAETASKKLGKTVAQVLADVTGRIKESHSNWEWFLDQKIPLTSEAASGQGAPSGQTGGQFEDPTTPAPEVAPSTAVQKTGFVPTKKSTVTLVHPGAADKKPFPGYPGVGYEAKVSYKKQTYTVKFTPDGKVSVVYPDASVAVFGTPNAACDSLYLWKNGLDLNLSAKEKKAKGISYSATKMLKLKEFAKELEEYGVPEPAPAPPPEPKTLEQVLADHGNGEILDMSIVPTPVQEWAGMSKVNGGGGKVYASGAFLVVPFYDVEGKSAYKSWQALTGGELQGFPPTADGAHFAGVPKLPPKKKAVGQAPPAVATKKAKVTKPAAAPSVSPGPLPDGTIVTVQKTFKGSSKKQGVELKVEAGKFHVKLPGEDNWEGFNSLSAASNHVWLAQKGYESADAYKKATGKKKVPGGGGWKFWGLKPGELPASTPKAPSPAAEPTPSPQPSEDNFETMPEGGTAGVGAGYKTDADSVWTTYDWVPGGGAVSLSQGSFLKELPPGSAVSVGVSHASGATYAIEAVKLEPNENAQHSFSLMHPVSGDEVTATATGLKLLIQKYAFKGDNGVVKVDVAPPGAETLVTQKAPATPAAPEPSPAADALPFAAKQKAYDAWQGVVAAGVPFSLANLSKEVQQAFFEQLPPGAVLEAQSSNAAASPVIITMSDAGVLYHNSVQSTAEEIVAGGGAVTENFFTVKLHTEKKEVAPPATTAPPPKQPFVQLAPFKLSPLEIADLPPKTEAKTPNGVFQKQDDGNWTNAMTGGAAPLAALPIEAAAEEGKLKVKLPPEVLDAVSTYFPNAVVSGPEEGSAPPAKEVVQKMPEEMGPAEASALVQTQLILPEAFQHLEFVKKHPQLKIKPHAKAPGVWNIVTDKKDVDNDTGLDLIQQLLKEHGIQTYSTHPKSNGLGAFATVTAKEAQKLHTVNAPAGDVNSTASKNNFETMPEVETKSKKKLKTIAKSNSIKVKLQKLGDLSLGTQVVFGDGSKFVKVSDTMYKSEGWGTVPNGVNYTDFAVAQQIGFKGGCKLLPKGADLPDKLPKAKPVAPAVQKPPPPPTDPQKEAKKAWAKKWKSPEPDVTSRLPHLAKAAGLEGGELYARQDGFFVALGDGTQATAEALREALLKANPAAGVGGVEETPFGPMVVVPRPDLEKATPGAETVKGPDGSVYPTGTTFAEEKVFKTMEAVLEQEPGKLSPYVGSQGALYEKTYKITKDGDPTTALQLAASVQKKLGIDTPVKEGAHYVLFPIPKGTLQKKSAEFDLQVTATKPPQPKPVKTKPLGVSSGPANYGQPAPVNRDDLGSLGSVQIGRFGHKVTVGRGGVFMDGGVRVFRVKHPDGKVYHRVVGELTSTIGDAGTLASKGFKQDVKIHLGIAEKEHTVLKGWAPENDFDEATGTHTLGPKEVWTDHKASFYGQNLSGSDTRLYAFKDNIHTLERHFVLEVPEGADVEQAMAESLQKLGVDVGEGMAEPDEVDRRIMAKQQVLASAIGATGRRQVAKLRAAHKPATREHWESVLDSNLKGKVAPEHLEDLEVVVGANGQHVVRLNDLDDVLGKSVKFGVTAISHKGMTNMLMQGGYGAQWHRCLTGNSKNIDSSGPTTSGSSDMKTGGGFGFFGRFANGNVNSISGCGVGKPLVVVHPRAFKKTNWYAHNGDKFGSQEEGKIARKDIVSEITSPTNEFCMEDLGPEDVAGFILSNQKEKTEFLNNCKKAGITELNGVALADCVAVGSVWTNLAETAQALPLLKEPL